MAESNQPVAAPQMTLVAVPTVVPQGTESLVIQPVNVSALCAEYEKKLFPLLDEGSRLLGLAQEKKPGSLLLAAAGQEVRAALKTIEPFYTNIDKSIAELDTLRECFETKFANAIKGTVDISKLEEAVEQTLEQAKLLVGEGHQLVGPPGKPLSPQEKKQSLLALKDDIDRKNRLNTIHKTLEATAEMAKSL